MKGSTNWMTWAIFSDKSPAGRVERKYITDVIARPRPLVVAGRVERYGNDFATLTFEMTLKTDPALSATEFFAPAERHYPGILIVAERGCVEDQPQRVGIRNGFVSCGCAATGRDDTAALRAKMRMAGHYLRGFRVEVGAGLTLVHDSRAKTLRTLSAADSTDREQAKLICWDDDAQHLIIEKWTGTPRKMTVRVLPEMLK